MNCYHIVRLSQPRDGVQGKDMATDDPRRVRHYVRAATIPEAMAKMAVKFPKEDFAIIYIEHNVAPLAWELGEEKMAA